MKACTQMNKEFSEWKRRVFETLFVHFVNNSEEEKWFKRAAFPVIDTSKYSRQTNREIIKKQNIVSTTQRGL